MKAGGRVSIKKQKLTEAKSSPHIVGTLAKLDRAINTATKPSYDWPAQL